ncbi:MAG: AIR synthase-related protein [bacterium]|nr:AIR synthase-related protein [bacterium]MDZ4295748.1 AIR synthase-related protein [Patescibacteria group bacterium]
MHRAPEGNESEYRKYVDARIINPWKALMRDVARRTREFPERKGILFNPKFGVRTDGWQRVFPEGLGHKNLIAQWLDEHDAPARRGGAEEGVITTDDAHRPEDVARRVASGIGRHYHGRIMADAMQMAIIDTVCKWYTPVTYGSIVDASGNAYYADDERRHELADGCLWCCAQESIALDGGESAVLRLLVNAQGYVKDSSVFNGAVLGLLPRGKEFFLDWHITAGDRIIGAVSSGLHANGSTLIVERAKTLPDGLFTKLPSGMCLGEAALTPTRSYAALMEALRDAEVEVHKLIPSTGGGVAKPAAVSVEEMPFTFLIHDWVPVIPEIFQYMESIGVSRKTCLETFNMGVGFWIVCPQGSVEAVLRIGQGAGYELYVLGEVCEGPRQVIVEPGGREVLLAPED